MDDKVMLLVDLLQHMSRAQRALSAHRWGIEPGAAAMVAERLVSPEVATRLYRRVSEAGAPNLIRVLTEYGGAPFEPQPSLEAEASVLREWGLLVEDERGWRLPGELAVAMERQRGAERYFLSTLLARLDGRALREVAEELSFPLAGSFARQIVGLAREIVARADMLDEATRHAAQTTARLQSAALPRLGEIEAIAGSAGQRFRITLDGIHYEIAPREISELVGHQFQDVTVRALQPAAFSLGQVPSFPVLPVSALLVFPSGEALQDALRSHRFSELVEEQIGAQRVLLRAGITPAKIREELVRIGFEGVLDAGIGGSHAGG